MVLIFAAWDSHRRSGLEPGYFTAKDTNLRNHYGQVSRSRLKSCFHQDYSVLRDSTGFLNAARTA